MKNKKKLTIAVYAIGILLTLSLALAIFTELSALDSIRIVFGSLYVLFLPGFVISYIFFRETKSQGFANPISRAGSGPANEKEEKGIDWIERIALSFALSIAIVPLAVFYLNLIGLRINLLNSFLTILGILILSGFIVVWKSRRKS